MKYLFAFLGIAGVTSGFFLPSITIGDQTHFFDSYLVIICAGVVFFGILANIKILLVGILPLLVLKAITITKIVDFLNETEGSKLGYGTITGYLGMFLLIISCTMAFSDSTINSKLTHNTKEIRY